MKQPSVQLPSALEAHTRWERLEGNIPCIIVTPPHEAEAPAPALIWMHGRTVRKEIDPGRYLRLMRSGIGVCAVDLPGHGERFDSAMQDPAHALHVIQQMIEEIDVIVDSLRGTGDFDHERLAIGGMSAGGMATLGRLCQPHSFLCAAVEAASGSWDHQRHREMFRHCSREEVARLDPINRLDGWREIPLQAIHSRLDSWVAWDGQAAFIEALRERYRDPDLLEFITYERTGAPFEHAGFGRRASDAKDRQRSFLKRWLLRESQHSSAG